MIPLVKVGRDERISPFIVGLEVNVAEEDFVAPNVMESVFAPFSNKLTAFEAPLMECRVSAVVHKCSQYKGRSEFR